MTPARVLLPRCETAEELFAAAQAAAVFTEAYGNHPPLWPETIEVESATYNVHWARGREPTAVVTALSVRARRER